MPKNMDKHWADHQVEEVGQILHRDTGTAESHDFLAAGARYLLENYRAVLMGELRLPK